MRSREAAMANATVRYRVHVRGTVQGVGFRPFIYRLAHDEGLSGWVRNDSSGVVIEVEGPAEGGLVEFALTPEVFDLSEGAQRADLRVLDRLRVSGIQLPPSVFEDSLAVNL